uniref:Uncharacterized protein n=1 Tax=Schistosoma haematobium TaxID=6185 RepID=A0A095C6B4_SCHHA
MKAKPAAASHHRIGRPTLNRNLLKNPETDVIVEEHQSLSFMSTNMADERSISRLDLRDRYRSQSIDGEIVLLTVQRCDSSKVFPSDNQHDSDAAFPQGGVGSETVDPKSTHLPLSHGYLSPAVRSLQVRS